MTTCLKSEQDWNPVWANGFLWLVGSSAYNSSTSYSSLPFFYSESSGRYSESSGYLLPLIYGKETWIQENFPLLNGIAIKASSQHLQKDVVFTIGAEVQVLASLACVKRLTLHL